MEIGGFRISKKLTAAAVALIVEVVLVLGVDAEVAQTLGEFLMKITVVYLASQGTVDAVKAAKD